MKAETERGELMRNAMQAGELAGYLECAARQICKRLSLEERVIPLALLFMLVGSKVPKRAVGHVLRLLYKMEEVKDESRGDPLGSG